MRKKETMNDLEFLDITTYTLGGVQTVHRFYDDFPKIKWGGENGFTRNRTKYTKWYKDNTLDKIFVELAKKSENKA
tara:strand:- start:457 stop:684 length:228 start_codon:yes stop_codon:yes gene_type:complete